MLVRSSTVFAGLSAGFAFATPMTEHRKHRLEDIQCRCLTFRANERPSPCNFFDSKGFGWRSAQILASQYDIQVQFASKDTIAEVLSIPTPLPNDILQTVSNSDALSASSQSDTSHNKIVCGFGKEVRRMSNHQELEEESHFVGQVIAWLMLLIIIYAAGEYVWIRYILRSSRHHVY